jgi:hypothetical protein
MLNTIADILARASELGFPPARERRVGGMLPVLVVLLLAGQAGAADMRSFGRPAADIAHDARLLLEEGA